MRKRPQRRAAPFIVAGLLAGGLALALFRLAGADPERVEALYTTGVYPWVIGAFSWISGLVPFSVAELLIAAACAFVIVRLVWRLAWRVSGRVSPASDAPRSSAASAVLRRVALVGVFALASAGALYAIFIVVWGLNYARPRLEHRLGLPDGQIEEPELVRLATRVAAETTRAHQLAGLPLDAVSTSPLDMRELSVAIDDAYELINLPGDPGPRGASPIKPAVFSGLMSRLGISGVFIPFTGEPTVNTGPPDVAVAFTAAHEKAHQRAVTHEGEASFVAYLALSRQQDHPYLTYAAWFYASRHLLAATRNAEPEGRDRAWAALGPGPRRDLDALNAYWARYRGMARTAAQRVNDSYLRTMRIPDGARSYGTVARLLIADLRRQHPEPPPTPTDTDHGAED